MVSDDDGASWSEHAPPWEGASAGYTARWQDSGEMKLATRRLGCSTTETTGPETMMIFDLRSPRRCFSWCLSRERGEI